MTDNVQPDDRPTRALGAVTPPDQWSDITERAASPGAMSPLGSGEPVRSRRPYLLAAAAVLVVAAIAGGLSLASRDDGGTDQVVAGPTGEGMVADPDPTDDDETETAVVPSGEASCAVGLNASVDPGASWPLGAGRSDPAVVDPSWGDLEGDATQGIWNLVDEDQRIEIHVPGLMVMDLVGERTEEVLLGENWKATVWFTDEWVQVRYFGGSETPNPCVSFTVTATGATEEQNRDTAVAIARSLVIREWPDETGEHDGSTTPSVGQDAEPSDPLIPSSADSEDVDLREWMGNSGPLLLTAVEVDGSVQEAADTPMGGSGDGGPIALHARFGEGQIEIRGCQAVTLTLEERDGRPTINLPSGSISTAGCDGTGGDQMGQVLKIISLGPVTRLVETSDERFLVLETEEGSAAFRWPL